jgi:hypothetical protein
MALSIGNVSSNTGVGSSTLSVSNPGGIAVGDLLIGILTSDGGYSTIPSGFSAPFDCSSSGGITYFIYKIATSGDVAASYFTWTGLTGTKARDACIFVVKGGTVTSGVLDNRSFATDTTTVSGITQDKPNAMYFSVVVGYNRTGSGGAGTVAINTPTTLTNIINLNSSDSDRTLTISAALRSGVGYTGTGTATTSNFSLVSGGYNCGIFLINERSDFSLNVSDTYSLSDSVYSSGKAQVTTSDQVTTESEKQRWRARGKHNGTWEPLDRSVI